MCLLARLAGIAWLAKWLTVWPVKYCTALRDWHNVVNGVRRPTAGIYIFAKRIVRPKSIAESYPVFWVVKLWVIHSHSPELLSFGYPRTFYWFSLYGWHYPFSLSDTFSWLALIAENLADNPIHVCIVCSARLSLSSTYATPSKNILLSCAINISPSWNGVYVVPRSITLKRCVLSWRCSVYITNWRLGSFDLGIQQRHLHR